MSHQWANVSGDIIDRLRESYTTRGFKFIAHPERHQLPAFLGSYRPDAIALKPGDNIAIQVIDGPLSQGDRSIRNITSLFQGRQDWHLVVNYPGTEPRLASSIPVSSAEAISRRLDDVFDLARQGERQAAFLIAWSLLEAALRRLEPGNGRPQSASGVIEALAMLGLLSPEQEQSLRPLARLRNRIAHGDISAEPSEEDLQLVLATVKNVIA